MLRIMNEPDEKIGVILLVDDQPESIHVVKAALDKHFILKIATRGELALKIAALGGIDLILLDVVMPGMDGYEVCRRLKADVQTQDIPIIFLTSKDNQEDEMVGLRLGADDFIRKPSNPSIVLLRCINIVTYQRTKSELAQRNHELQQSLIVRENIERLARHDLKGPLTGIIGVPQILLEADNLTEGQKSILKMMEKSGYAMLEMINRSLDLFKMENGSYLLNPERFDLLEILERIAADLKRSAATKGVTIQIVPPDGGPCEVVGEKMLCYPMFFNLILNAIEASNHNDIVVVHWSSGFGGKSVRITNSGEVPQAIRERFFDKYVTSGKRNGTGLGTYSAWLSARTQHGEIALDSSQPGKTSVVVTLPFSEAFTKPAFSAMLHPAI
ncbi:MAG: response regulator [Magnetococcus sp. THC-1_WYH]